MDRDYLTFVSLIRQINRDVRKSWHMNLPGPKVHLLDTLRVHGSQKMGDLAETLGISLSAVTALAKRMIEEGTVERTVSNEDKRVVLMSLTKDGENYLSEFSKKRNQALDKYFSKLTEEESEMMFFYIQKMLDQA